MASNGQDEVKKQKQVMGSQLDKATMDVEGIVELDDGQMKGVDNTNDRRVMRRRGSIRFEERYIRDGGE